MTTKVLEDGKADDVVVIDLAGKTTFADSMIVCGGQTRRQVTALADRVATALKGHGRRITSMEGYDPGDWILIDLGDVIVHIFHNDLRSLYNLERMWAMPTLLPVEATA